MCYYNTSSAVKTAPLCTQNLFELFKRGGITAQTLLKPEVGTADPKPGVAGVHPHPSSLGGTLGEDLPHGGGYRGCTCQMMLAEEAGGA